MSFPDAVRTAFSKYTVWQGRASRAEYWWFVLFYAIVVVVAEIIDAAAHTFIIVLLVALAMLLPSLALVVRRLHDTGRNGAWYWIVFVPFVGGIILIVFMLLPSDPGPNRYGDAPNRAGAPSYPVS